MAHVYECLILVTSKKHERFGQVGRLRHHNREFVDSAGILEVDFLDGQHYEFDYNLGEKSKSPVENIHHINFTKRLTEIVGRDNNLFYLNLDLNNKRFGQPGVIIKTLDDPLDQVFRVQYIDRMYLDYETVKGSSPKYKIDFAYPCILGDGADLVHGIYLLTNNRAIPNVAKSEEEIIFDSYQKKVSYLFSKSF